MTSEVKSAKATIQIHCANSKLVPIGEIKPNPKNPNKHPKKQLEALGRIYATTGVRKPAVVSNRSGLLVTGHGSVEAAKMIGMEQFPIDFQDFKDEAQETAHMIADNQIAELAEIDETEMAGLLAEMNRAAADVTLTGFTQTEIDNLLNPPAGQGKRSVNVTGIIQYNIVFESVEQQQSWFDFLRKIKAEFPGDDETIGSRLTKYINAHGKS